MKSAVLVAALAVVALGVAAPPPAIQSYSLSSPDLSLTLPVRLAEVSGVTALSETTVAMVQDEDGVVFVYDLTKQQVTAEIRFGPQGDYEDIVKVESRLYVLRSDGVLFEIQGLTGSPPVRAYDLGLPSWDLEGLCLDSRRGRLLVAPKSRLGARGLHEDSVPILGFDLASARMQSQPIMGVSGAAVGAFAGRQGAAAGGREQKKGKKSSPGRRLMPSAVGVHPTTSEVFVLSAVAHALVTFDGSGAVTGYSPLDPKLFRQPEGLAFLPSGDLVITNEAAGRQATLLLFRRRNGGKTSQTD